MVAFDTSLVLFAIDPKTRAPKDPSTGALVTNCDKRVEYLIKRLGQEKEEILIPTPVLAEFLVKAGPNRAEYADKFLLARNFTMGDFERRAAIELAYLTDADLNSNKVLSDVVSKAKVKFDRQIIAIAKVNEVETIYTADKPLADRARENGIKAVLIWELPEPPEPPQMNLSFPSGQET